MIADRDWSALRAHFPALKGRTYLNTAGGGPMCREATEAARSILGMTLVIMIIVAIIIRFQKKKRQG